MNQKGYTLSERSKSKGFAPILIILTIVLLLGVAGGAYYLGTIKNSKPESAPSIVTNQNNPQPTISSKTTLTPTPDETANWKVYTFEPFKLNFKYPEGWFVDSSGSAQFPTLRIQNYNTNTAPQRGYDVLRDKGKYLLQIDRLPWGDKGIFSLIELKNKILKDGEDAYYLGDPAGKVVIKTERELEINSFPALYRETSYTDEPKVLEKTTYMLDKSGYAIRVSFGLDESGGKEILNKILSTFKFLP